VPKCIFNCDLVFEKREYFLTFIAFNFSKHLIVFVFPDMLKFTNTHGGKQGFESKFKLQYFGNFES
jgi:hypothetical protein